MNGESSWTGGLYLSLDLIDTIACFPSLRFSIFICCVASAIESPSTIIRPKVFSLLRNCVISSSSILTAILRGPETNSRIKRDYCLSSGYLMVIIFFIVIIFLILLRKGRDFYLEADYAVSIGSEASRKTLVLAGQVSAYRISYGPLHFKFFYISTNRKKR